jgi:hypothetical protein
MTLRVGWGLLACFQVMTASALTLDPQLAGFGSFIGGKNLDGNGSYYQDFGSGEMDWQTESLVGLQVDTPVTDRTTAVVQWLAAGNNQWSVETEWAYLRHQWNPTLSFKLGRVNVPFFLFSDYLSVGYSLPWVTGPTDVYNVPLSSVDGGSILKTGSLGVVDWQTEAYGGGATFTPRGGLFRDQTLQTRDQVGIALEVSWQDWRFRLSEHRAEISIIETAGPDWTVVESLAQTLENQGFLQAAEDVRLNGDPVRFSEAALQYDDGRWVLIAELKRLQPLEIAPLPDDLARYATLGRRFGPVLLHATWSDARDERPQLGRGLPPGTPFLAAVNTLSAVVSPTNTTRMLGVRWDVEPDLVFKLEWQEVSDYAFDPVYLPTGGGYRLVKGGVQFVF